MTADINRHQITQDVNRMTYLEEGDQSVESASGDFEQFHVEMRLKKQKREERRQKLGQGGEQMRRSGGGGGGGGERRRGSGIRRRRIAGVGRQTTEKGQRMRRNLGKKIDQSSTLKQCNVYGESRMYRAPSGLIRQSSHYE